MKHSVLGRCSPKHEVLIAQSVANWLCTLFKCNFAIATTTGLAATCSLADARVSFLSFDEDMRYWKVFARKGFFTTADFQRDIHGKIVDGVRELLTLWHGYEVKGQDHGDVKWPEMCADMRAKLTSSKSVLNAYNNDSDDEYEIERMLAKSKVANWRASVVATPIEQLRPKFNPGIVECADWLHLEFGVEVTTRLPIIIQYDMEYKELAFNSVKRQRLEGNN